MNIIIVEDNLETLGVLRDFVRSLDAAHNIQTLSSGNPLLEKEGRIQADLIILGYDLGPSVTGCELLHYLEWSGSISAKTHVIFLSNTIELAKRQAPLRFTLNRFHEKPMSLGHLEEVLVWVKENQNVFSSVFYLIDKEKWSAAFNSLQLCKENCPIKLQQQAWLLECMLLLKLQRYAKVIRRYQLIQDYPWAKAVRLRALVSLGQLKAGHHAFNSMSAGDAYYSSVLASLNQLSLASNGEYELVLPESIKESELSLFECELKAALSVASGNLNQALVYLHNKQKRLNKRSHQAYFFAVSVLKTCFLHLLKDPTAMSAQELIPHMNSALDVASQHRNQRDQHLNEVLWPKLLENLESGAFTATEATTFEIGPDAENSSPISLLVKMYLQWVESGKLYVNDIEYCIELIERQGATSRAVCNQLLLELLLGLLVVDPTQRIELADALAARLSQAGKFDSAAYSLARALALAPDNQDLRNKLAACTRRLEVKQFLDIEPSLAET